MSVAKAVAQRSKVLQEESAEEEKRLAADARAVEAQRKVAEIKKREAQDKSRMKQEIAERRKKFIAGQAMEAAGHEAAYAATFLPERWTDPRYLELVQSGEAGKGLQI